MVTPHEISNPPIIRTRLSSRIQAFVRPLLRNFALTFDYGQRARANEIEHASMICRKFDVLHEVIELSWIRRFSGALTDASALPELAESASHVSGV